MVPSCHRYREMIRITHIRIEYCYKLSKPVMIIILMTPLRNIVPAVEYMNADKEYVEGENRKNI